MEHSKTCKYLGINKANGINHIINKEIRKIILEEKKSHVKNRTECKNKVIAINTLAIPVMTYSFDIINWTLAEI